MILRDQEILKLIKGSRGKPPIVAPLQIPDPPFSKKSPIQPSSLDLTIGRIFVPEAPEDGEGGMNSGATDYWLEPGHTAVIITKEQLNFPATLAGFGFPPTRISSSAILMTNPGHIDPGFKGYLNFTVINMGRNPFRLRAGETIVTCLLVDLSEKVAVDYTQQGHLPTSERPRRSTIESLSRDFLNFRQRSTEIAGELADQSFNKFEIAQRKRDIWLIGISLVAILVTLVVAWLPIYFSLFFDLREKTTQLSEKVRILEEKIQTTATK